MTARLIESPAEMAATGTLAGAYASAFAAQGTRRLVANAASRMLLGQAAGHFLPVTVDDGGFGLSYVANPHSAYVLYARREMDLVGMRRGRRAAGVALGLLDAALRAVRIDRIVHIDNWLLSTNLHGSWKGQGLAEIRVLLSARFPRHFLALRSLDDWSSPQLLAAARADGWLLLPARQIWVVDDLARDWRLRGNAGHDRRALARSGLLVEASTPLDDARIAELYGLLYLDKYSSLNPVFTAGFVRLTHEIGMIDYRVAREASGRVQAVAGMWAREGVMTPPVVGYDTSQPQNEALYRIASYLFCEAAETKGWRLHGSAGAAAFKRNRGAHGVIEYLAIYAGHLTAARRAPVAALASALEHLVVPMMRREGW